MIDEPAGPPAAAPLVRETDLHVCPACGYRDGFHVSFQLATAGATTAAVILICPNCHRHFRLGWQIDLLPAGDHPPRGD
ncbi:MAG: hypothetical protein AB1634_14530 [Thermodesulfobacteriota bacterium]